MAIGAALATNRQKPIFAIMGDGAVGAGGMDIETAVRWNIPAVFCHENNGTMVTGGWKYFSAKWCSPTGNRLLDSWETMPNIRYDRMFKEFGCHTEFVERDAELKPALKAAFDYVKKECKPAFVEVMVEEDVLQEIWGLGLVGALGNMPWEGMTEEGQRLIDTKVIRIPIEYFMMVHPSWQPHLL